jgi:hypothetical protein
VHARNYRLGDAVDGLHQLGTGVKEPLVESEIAAGHLAEIVAGRERAPCSGDHDCPHVWLRADAAKRGDQGFHQLERERVALLGPVECDACRRPLRRQKDGFEFGRRICCHVSVR